MGDDDGVGFMVNDARVGVGNRLCVQIVGRTEWMGAGRRGTRTTSVRKRQG